MQLAGWENNREPYCIYKEVDLGGVVEDVL